MGLLGVLKSLNFENLSDAEKAHMKRQLLAHKKQLTTVTKVVDRQLKKLAKAKKRKS
jgi:hypothetical protein